MHLNARIISSDGRPFPSIEYSDSLTVMPGERYQVLLQSTYELEDNIEIDYFSLNTLSVANTQNIHVSISGYFSQNESTNEIIKLYPNPSSSKISFSKEINFIHLFDNNGRLLKTKRNSGYIDISYLAKGIYHLNIDSESTTIIKN